jgi:hypothetical protein
MSNSTLKARPSLGVRVADAIGGLFLVLLALVVLTMVMPIPSLFSFRRTKTLQVMIEMKGLEMALKGYATEYDGKHSLAEFWKDERTPILAEGEILKVLTDENERLNPRKIAFWEPPSERGSKKRPGTVKQENGNLRLVDNNGNPIWILMDLDGDKRIPNPIQMQWRAMNRSLQWPYSTMQETTAIPPRGATSQELGVITRFIPTI